MDVDLFIKKMPQVVKDLISREAFGNRRSLNQEAIALLEEALLHRVGTGVLTRKQIETRLEEYANSGPGKLAPNPIDIDLSRVAANGAAPVDLKLSAGQPT